MVELSGWELLLGATFEMDGVVGVQWASFAVAQGATPATLRDRALVTFGACFEHLVRKYAAELDVEPGDYPYRIIELHGFNVRRAGSKRWLEMEDTDNDWVSIEQIVFGQPCAWTVETFG